MSTEYTRIGWWRVVWGIVWFWIVSAVGVEAQGIPSPATPQAAMPTIHPFGVETNPGWINNPTIQQRAKDMGISWLRLNTLSWRNLQLAENAPPEHWNWAAVDTFVQELQSAKNLGLTPMIIADDFPDWAVIPYGGGQIARCAALKDEYFDDYAQFLREVLLRYKDLMRGADGNIYLELGNEPDVDPSLIGPELQALFGCWGNIADPYYGGEQYGKMLKVVTPLVRQVDPGVRVIIGGLLLDRPETTAVGRGKPEKFFEGILRAGGGDYFDIVGFHAYPWYDWERAREGDTDLYDARWANWGGTTIGKVRFLRRVMETYGVDRPLVLNEVSLLCWGCSEDSSDVNYLQYQADHLVRVMVRGLSANVQAFTWYTLHASGWNSSGLMNSDRTLRPSAIAYQQLIKQTKQATRMPVAVESYGEAIEAYRFAGAQQHLDVLWQRAPAPSQSHALTADTCAVGDGGDEVLAAQCRIASGEASKIDLLNLAHRSDAGGRGNGQITNYWSWQLARPSWSASVPEGSAQPAALKPIVVTIPRTLLVAAYTRDGQTLAPTNETETRVFFSIGVEPTYLIQKPLVGPLPTLLSSSPPQAYNDQSTTLTIAGTNFVEGVEVFLEQPETKLHYQLDPVMVLGPEELVAEVPTGLPPATYDVVVRFPSGWVSDLRQSYRVVAHTPTITRIWPEQGRTNFPNLIFVEGENFARQAKVQMGDRTIPTTMTMVVSPTLIRLTIPPGFLLPGSYAVTVTNPDTTKVTKAESFTVLFFDEHDVFGYAYQLWTHPLSPRVGQSVQTGLKVHHWSDYPLHTDVPVVFSLGGNEIGRAIIPSPVVSNSINTVIITWTAEVSKTHTLSVVIGDDSIAERNRANNVVQRPLTILPWGTDQTPPVARLTINGQKDGAVTTDPVVTLRVRAVDEPSGSFEGSPPMENAWVIFQEYEYSPGLAQWVPVQHGQWHQTRGDSTWQWRIVPSGAKTYVLAWVADASGNISQPAAASVTYHATSASGSTIQQEPPGEPGREMVPPLPLPPQLSGEASARAIYLPLVIR